MFKIILLTIGLFLPLLSYADIDSTSAAYVQYRLNDGKSTAELGIGTSARLNEYADVRTIISVITDGIDDRARINIGLMDFHTSKEDIGFRIGRVQHELGFYTSQLNWAPARDLYLAPQGIYRENFRYMLRSGDGIQVYSKFNVFDVAQLSAEFSYTKPVLYPMEDIVKVWGNIGGELNDSKSTSRGINLVLDVPTANTVIRYDQQQLNYLIENTSMNMFNGEINTRGHYFGGRTEISDTVDVTYEYLIVEKYGSTYDTLSKFAEANGVGFTKENAVGYGLSGSWQIVPSFKLIGGYSAFYPNPSDKSGTVMSALTNLPKHNYYMEDTFIGGKYRKDKWISTLEFHHIDGTATLSLKDSQTKGEHNNRWIFTVTRMF